MHLPSIFNSNQSKKDKHDSTKKQSILGIGNQFGLGIEVFKISSAKTIGLTQHSNKRKLIINLENPKNIIKPPLQKQRPPHQLPSLMSQEKINTDNIAYGKSLNKRVNVTTTQISTNYSIPKQTYSSKAVINKQTNSQKQIETIKQAVITYTYFTEEFNKIPNFYQSLQKLELGRQRQLKKLMKVNKNQISPELQTRFEWVSNANNCITDIVNTQKLDNFRTSQQFDEYQIEQYDSIKGFQNKQYSSFIYNQQ